MERKDAGACEKEKGRKYNKGWRGAEGGEKGQAQERGQGEKGHEKREGQLHFWEAGTGRDNGVSREGAMGWGHCLKGEQLATGKLLCGDGRLRFGGAEVEYVESGGGVEHKDEAGPSWRPSHLAHPTCGRRTIRHLHHVG
jgi:hypothetical protein